MSQKVKSIFSFGLSHGSVRTLAEPGLSLLAQTRVRTEPRLSPNLI